MTNIQTEGGGSTGLCVSCYLTNDVNDEHPICEKCATKHPVALRLYEIMSSEQVIPQPWTSWYWDNAMAKSTWQLALTCADYLSSQTPNMNL